MKVWKYGNVKATYKTEDVDSITFNETVDTGGAQDLGGGIYLINGHRFVDLGLPSGLLWAETNIGAKGAADYGDYFAWGETKVKDNYSWDTYKYGTSTYDNITKYDSTDCKTVLDKDDDAACIIWGDSCRMPTETEFLELCDTCNCTWTWTKRITSYESTRYGYVVRSNKNSNSIFLPISGYRYRDDFSFRGSFGLYWSSTLSEGNVASFPYYLSFCSGGLYANGVFVYRHFGIPVRPVAEP